MDIMKRLNLMKNFNGSGDFPLSQVCGQNGMSVLDTLDENIRFLNPVPTGKFLLFLLAQKPENRKVFFDTFKDNENFKESICFFKPQHVKIAQVKSIELFEVFVSSNYSTKWDMYLEYINKFSDDFIENSANIFAELLTVTNDFDIIEKVLSNKDFSNYELKTICSIVENAERIDFCWNNVSAENIEVLSRDEVLYIDEPVYKKLQLAKLLKQVHADDYLSRNALNIMNNIEISVSIIESLMGLLSGDELKDAINSFLSSNPETNHLEILKTKVSYGHVFTSEHELLELISGLDLNNMSLSDAEMIVQIKEVTNSKGFIKLLLSNRRFITLFRIYDTNSEKLGFISKIIELGQLNDSDLCELGEIIEINDSFDFLSGAISKKISFAELKYILEYKIDLEIVEKFINLKTSERLINLDNLHKIKNICMFGCFDFSDVVSQLDSRGVRWMMKNQNPLNISDLKSYVHYIMFLKNGLLVDSLTSLNKYSLLLKYSKDINKVKSIPLDDIDTALLSEDNFIDKFNKVGIDCDFLSKHLSNAIDFALCGDLDIAAAYSVNSEIDDTIHANLSKIVKSIILEKYDSLKYRFDDIYKEIHIDMNMSQFLSWKTDSVLDKDGFELSDKGDFKTIMTIGTAPVQSCMNYHSGAYSECLLSNFDTSKKILTVYKNGKYVARAILRLCKSTSYEPTNNGTLEFYDVDGETHEINKSKVDEPLTLFVEKMYSTLDSKDVKKLYPILIEFLKAKADDMGAKLVLSNFYYNYSISETYQLADRYVFISASKTGKVYLDSFDGSTTEMSCYKSARVINID